MAVGKDHLVGDHILLNVGDNVSNDCVVDVNNGKNNNNSTNNLQQEQQEQQNQSTTKVKRWLNNTAQLFLGLLLISLVIYLITIFTDNSFNEMDKVLPNLEGAKTAKLLSLIADIRSKLPGRSRAKSSKKLTLSNLVTKSEFDNFNKFCDMSHQSNCDLILSFLRKNVLPILFTDENFEDNIESIYQPNVPWSEAGAISLGKKDKKTYTISEESVVVTSGDDSMVFGDNFFIVSDGVSSNRHSAYLSRNLILLTDAILPILLSHTTTVRRAEQILADMLEVLQEIAHKLHLEGGATFSIGIRKDKNIITIATLGDSEVKIVRNSSLIWSSPFQRQQKHNIPGQINGRNAEIIQRYTIDTFSSLQKNDIIIGATDGLWDNMRFEESVRLVDKSSEINDRMLNSFMDKVVKRRNGKWEEVCDRKRCYGGHMDDISIFIAKV